MKHNKPKRRFSLHKEDILPIIIIIALVAVFAFLAAFIYNSRDIIKDFFADIDKKTASQTDNNMPDLPYVLETKYIGGIGYPQVYEYPFEKNEMYKTNKQLWIDHPERVTPICDTAKEYMTRLLNVSAKDIVSGSTYTDSLYELMDPYWRYDEDEIEGGVSVEEYLEQWRERVIDNNISIESEFLTDTSLVYVNGLYYVRGILEYTVYESDDPEIPEGEKKAAMVEVALHISNEVSDDFDVVRVEVMNTDDIPLK